MSKRIMFVCTGNTCRSPMAEALFKDLLAERGMLEEFEVSSAGIYAYAGDPASHEAIDVMRKEFGIDLSSHRARVLDDADIKNATLILAMTGHHREMILDVYPEAADRVFTLKNFAGDESGNPDISDPFGQDYEAYEACASEIEELLVNVLDKIQ